MQQSDKDLPSREIDHLLHLYRKWYPNLPEPEQEDFEQTLLNAPYIIKRTQQRKLRSSMIQRYNLQNTAKACFESTLNSPLSLIRYKNYEAYEDELNDYLVIFNTKYGWNLNINEYEAHLIHIFY